MRFVNASILINKLYPRHNMAYNKTFLFLFLFSMEFFHPFPQCLGIFRVKCFDKSDRRNIKNSKKKLSHMATRVCYVVITNTKSDMAARDAF